MRTISRRLKKLEEAFEPAIKKDDHWGSMAPLRDQLLRQAQQHGEPFVAEINRQLAAMGPIGLWATIARDYLSDHGFEQGPNESFAQTMARALGIGTAELTVRIREGRLVKDLLNRFDGAKTATDNGS